MPTFVQYTYVEPALMARVARRVAPHPVIVHVDAKVDIAPFRDAARGIDNLRLLEHRTVVNWAGWSQVVAIRRLVAEALRTTADDDYVVLLSGQDYPIRPVAEFADFLAAADGTQFLRYFLVDESLPHYWDQLSHRHFRDLPVLRRGARVPRLRRARNAMIRALESGPTSRPLTPPTPVAHGCTHFALTARCLRDLEARVTPADEAYFRQVFCPEEHFYQSLLAADPTYAGTTVAGGPDEFVGRGNYHYQNLHHVHPSLRKVYELTDWDEVASSSQWFLRKLESGRSATLLDRIDVDLLNVSD